MERMERIEDLDVRGFCAQGTVDAGGTIPISTVSCLPVDYPLTGLDGLLAARTSFCQCGF